MGPPSTGKKITGAEFGEYLQDEVYQDPDGLSYQERQAVKQSEREERRIAQAADRLLARGASFDTYIDYLASTEKPTATSRKAQLLPVRSSQVHDLHPALLDGPAVLYNFPEAVKMRNWCGPKLIDLLCANLREHPSYVQREAVRSNLPPAHWLAGACTGSTQPRLRSARSGACSAMPRRSPSSSARAWRCARVSSSPRKPESHTRSSRSL